MTSPSCRFCNTPLTHTFCDLGTSPLSNAYVTEEQLDCQERRYPLHAYVCSHCLLVQLPSLHTSDEIFSEYAYFSSYSSSWLAHCQAYAQAIITRLQLSSTSLVMEIASNDGYLLQFFKEAHIPILGIEPAKNVAQVAIEKGIPTRVDFFGLQLAQKLPQKADLLVGNNVLAHVPDLHDFIRGLKCALKPQGVSTIEFPHLLKLMQERQFDTIYHEHFSYFSLLTVTKIFAYHGLELFDVEELPTHGGSLRIYIKHREDNSKTPSPSLLRVMQEERAQGLDRLDSYLSFMHKVEEVKNDLQCFLQHMRLSHKKVAAYGAPAKGNTLLNYCCINRELLSFTVDRNPYKQGKFLPGTHIPVFSPDVLYEEKPDYLLILPWNLKEELFSQNAFIREWGGKFVLPLPSLAVLE